MDFARLEEALREAGATQESPDVPVFYLGSPWPQTWGQKLLSLVWSPIDNDLHKRQSALLDVLLGMAVPLYVQPEDDPNQWDGENLWNRVADQTWEPPRGLSAEELRERWLEIGNWQLFTAPTPNVEGPWIDTWRCKPEELMEFMERNDMELLLHSFHDDHDWKIAFRRSS